ncbi:sporulation-specific protein 15 isoform X1 [Gossypium australe]|uniref:Sporulation-specific protein 15 isoform X1 n=1 Tax=Gossypium australe TaxID=47621 RepID=A0A5B6W2C7_9ROSI|nr:sporulation-specific protein 15 isoform X1 [Gossypium australe]
MATKEDEEKPETPIPSKPSPNSKDIVSQPKQKDVSPSTLSLSPKELIVSAAANISSHPLPTNDPNVWGVLTAISNNARKRQQGMNMLLTADEHCIGRSVKETSFRIDSNSVSAVHCKIYRKRVTNEDTQQAPNCYTSVFLKDTSTNGTYLNWERLRKNSPEFKVQHGDIISFSAPPQHELAFAFVYREVLTSNHPAEGACAKRKADCADELTCENKRLKGIGIGAPEGPISLDDFRSLQRSNRELRKQLEDQVLTIDTLRNENRATVERHENEIKEVKESVATSYLDQIKELQILLDGKQKELVEVNRISAEQKHAIEDLNERLSASLQSCTEANGRMKSQKASIAELKVQLDEERDQRREEREKATADLKAAVRRAQFEAQEELQRLSDVYLKRETEKKEVINKLEESLRKSSAQVEDLVSKLEDTRHKLVDSDNKVRQLETQVCEEQKTSANTRKKVEELEHEIKGLRKELETEKAAREEAWAKVSALELEINATMRDLDYERRRLKGARERIMLRETQLRAFYSTTEEISILFAKQQEQLKAMQRTLEDEENYENTSVDIDLNVPYQNVNGTRVREKASTGHRENSTMREGSTTSAQRVNISSDEASVTEKHDCGMRSQDVGKNTQEAEFTSADRSVKGTFGFDVDDVGTTPILEGDPIGTERVLETESFGIEVEPNIDLNRCGTLGGDTMQFDYETNAHESEERVQTTCLDTSVQSQLNKPHETQKSTEDKEAGGTIMTTDLLASEGFESQANGTNPSVHGENVLPKTRDNDKNRAMVGENQSRSSSEATTSTRNDERQALSEMIGIVAPDLKEQFVGAATSDSGSEDCADSEDGDHNNYRVAAKSGSISDAETEGSDQADMDQKHNDKMDDDDETTSEDSVG